MNIPNRLTVGRLILSPLFFIAYFIPVWTQSFYKVSAFLLVIVFLGIEISDFLDGFIARKYNLVTDIGKVLDPFADVVSRLTYFLCFSWAGIMPLWIFLVLMYRELGIIFFRMMMIKKGVVVAASLWGKMKAVTYAISGILGVLFVFMKRLEILDKGEDLFRAVLLVFFLLSAVAAVASFGKYVADGIKRGGA